MHIFFVNICNNEGLISQEAFLKLPELVLCPFLTLFLVKDFSSHFNFDRFLFIANVFSDRASNHEKIKCMLSISPYGVCINVHFNQIYWNCLKLQTLTMFLILSRKKFSTSFSRFLCVQIFHHILWRVSLIQCGTLFNVMICAAIWTQSSSFSYFLCSTCML